MNSLSIDIKSEQDDFNDIFDPKHSKIKSVSLELSNEIPQYPHPKDSTKLDKKQRNPDILTITQAVMPSQCTGVNKDEAREIIQEKIKRIKYLSEQFVRGHDRLVSISFSMAITDGFDSLPLPFMSLVAMGLDSFDIALDAHKQMILVTYKWSSNNTSGTVSNPDLKLGGVIYGGYEGSELQQLFSGKPTLSINRANQYLRQPSPIGGLVTYHTERGNDNLSMTGLYNPTLCGDDNLETIDLMIERMAYIRGRFVRGAGDYLEESFEHFDMERMIFKSGTISWSDEMGYVVNVDISIESQPIASTLFEREGGIVYL